MGETNLRRPCPVCRLQNALLECQEGRPRDGASSEAQKETYGKTMKSYFAFLGGIALFLALLAGLPRRTGHAESDWAHGLFAWTAWRSFLWIATGTALLAVVAASAVHFGWMTW